MFVRIEAEVDVDLEEDGVRNYKNNRFIFFNFCDNYRKAKVNSFHVILMKTGSKFLYNKIESYPWPSYIVRIIN